MMENNDIKNFGSDASRAVKYILGSEELKSFKVSPVALNTVLRSIEPLGINKRFLIDTCDDNNYMFIAKESNMIKSLEDFKQYCSKYGNADDCSNVKIYRDKNNDASIFIFKDRAAKVTETSPIDDLGSLVEFLYDNDNNKVHIIISIDATGNEYELDEATAEKLDSMVEFISKHSVKENEAYLIGACGEKTDWF